jgi:hypothetical protein
VGVEAAADVDVDAARADAVLDQASGLPQGVAAVPRRIRSAVRGRRRRRAQERVDRLEGLEPVGPTCVGSAWYIEVSSFSASARQLRARRSKEESD